MALISSLLATHYQGQTYLSFTKHSGATGGSTWSVWRKETQITSLTGLTAIATLNATSWQYLYGDSISPQLSSGFIIPNGSGGRTTLSSTKGLLVWTTDVTRDWYYCVTNDGDATVTVGTNSLTSPVAETHLATPGAFLIATPTDQGAYTAYQFFRWEDYSTWRTSDWGYYGHHFGVYRYDTGSVHPLTLSLHSAGAGYREPAVDLGHTPFGNGVEIVPIDLQFDTTEPYTGSTYTHSRWSGRLNSSTSHLVPITERRITDYVTLVRDNATGEGTDFAVDPNRIYIQGASLGSGSSHVFSHYPDLFAGLSTSLTYVRPVDDNDVLFGYGAIATAATLVDVPGRPTFGDWFSLQTQAENGVALPPSIYTYNKDDQTVYPWGHPELFTALEAAYLPYVSQWKDGNHAQFTIGAVIDATNDIGGGLGWDLHRFRKNELYLAFNNVSTSDAVGTINISTHFNSTGAGGNTGQRNYWLDWQSSLHSITGGAALVDTLTSCQVSLHSRSGTATVSVAVCNCQSFRPGVGARVNWSYGAQSGTTTVAFNDAIPIPALTVTTTAQVLSLTHGSGWQRISEMSFAPGITGGASPSMDTTGADFITGIATFTSGGFTEAITDNKGNTAIWGTVINALDFGIRARVFYMKNANGGTGHIFNITATGDFLPYVMVQAWSGSHLTSPFVEESTFGTDTEIYVQSIQAGEITPQGASDLVLTTVVLPIPTLEAPYQFHPAVDSGFSLIDLADSTTTSMNAVAAYALKTAPTNPTWSWPDNTQAAVDNATTGAAAAALTVTFRAAGASEARIGWMK